MRVSGTLRHKNAALTFDTVAGRLAGDLHNFKLKGLPTCWDLSSLQVILSKWAARNGFTKVVVTKTKETLNYWHASVTVSKPSVLITRSVLFSGCPACGAHPDQGCKSVPIGTYHRERPVGAKIG